LPLWSKLGANSRSENSIYESFLRANMNAKNYAGIAWPSIFLVLTGTYAYWASQRELVSSRPSTPGQFDVPDPVPTPGVRTIHSRMWEDPLARAYQHWKSLDNRERASGLRTIADKEAGEPAGSVFNAVINVLSADKGWAETSRVANLRNDMKEHYRDLVDKGATICLPVFVSGGPYAEDKERRMRTRYAVVTALAESGYALKTSDQIDYLVAKVFVRVLRGWQEREIVVPVKLYRDDHNKRPQVLVLWINEVELGLRPLLATHRILNEIFSDVKNRENLDISIVGPTSSDALQKMASDAGDPKPGEWKKLTGKVTKLTDNMNTLTDKVVVKLKEMELPTEGLEPEGLTSGNEIEANPKQMEAKLTVMEAKLTVMEAKLNVMEAKLTNNEAAPGDLDQEALTKLKQELASLKQQATSLKQQAASVERAYHWEISSYGPDKFIEGFTPLMVPYTLKDSKAYKVASIFSARATMDGIKFPANPFFKLYRVIGTDHQLALALRTELELRGVLPGKVVLITEHDTAYGRKIQGTFEATFGGTQDNNEQQEEKKGVAAASEKTAGELNVAKQADARTVYTFRILRGIDGILPGDAKESSMSSGRQGEQAEVVERPPEGRSQYDYLKRLPERIRAELPEGPVAIGVVGSDVYDKLLVLRALRPQFPDCVFFTTDLHAIYTHPNERQHTRNLVTASHFGTSLGNSLQRETPPFRDSYQTATFLATRLAIVADKTLNRATNFEMEADELEAAARENYFVRAVAKQIRTEAKNIRNANSAQELMLAADNIKAAAIRIKADSDSFESEIDRSVKTIEQKAVAVRNETEVAEHWQVWNDVLSKLGSDDQAHALINPMIHVVGRNRPHQLTGFDADSTEAKVHQVSKRGIRGWHVSFVAVVTLGAVCGVLLLTLRDRFRISFLLGRGRDYFEAAWIDEVQDWRKGLNKAFLALTGIGLLLTAGLVINALWGNDVATPLGGYTTWTRNILYAFAGMAAVAALAYLVDRFIVRLNEARQDGGKICERAWETFQMTHILKGGLLAVVFAQIGVLFVCGFNSLSTLCLSTVGFAALACAAWHYRTPLASIRGDVDQDARQLSDTKVNDILKKSLILSPCPRKTIWWAIGLMIAITGMAGVVGLLEGPAPGWRPSSMSRGWITRSGDWVVRAYAFGMVGVLLSSLLSSLVWCIEFSRYAKEQVSADFPSPKDAGLQMESELDRLRLVGKLTSVTGGLAPVVLGLLLVLVVAYHPVVSPTPMPMGLLAIITIGLGVFFGPILLVRWYFNSDRRQVLLELQKQLSVRPISIDDRQQKSTEMHASGPSELEDDSGEPELVPVLPSGGELSENESEERPRHAVRQPQPDRALPSAAANAREDRKPQLVQCKRQIEALSDGVFKLWARSPIGWILGGGAALALIDLWLRWWTLGA
jgi:hypothetical protein